MSGAVIEIVRARDQHKHDQQKKEEAPVPVARAVYEHPLVVRLCHWVNVVALFVMIGSGLQIFRAFPSFGAKIPQKDLLHWPKSLALGGWLGGALQWHLTFMWIYIATGLVYLGYQLFSGNYCQVLFSPVYGRWSGTISFLAPNRHCAKLITLSRNMLTPLSLDWVCSLFSPALWCGSRCSSPGSVGSWADFTWPACGISS
jgi:hypothetical protein